MNVEQSGDQLFFIDTNILVYAYDRSAGDKHRLASQLVERCWQHENGCISIQILQEFFVTVTRKIVAPLDPSTTRQIISDLAQWRMHSPDIGDLLQAIELLQRYSLSFWDGMVLQSAARLKCTRLFSEDLGHGQIYGDVQVINPFDELEK